MNLKFLAVGCASAFELNLSHGLLDVLTRLVIHQTTCSKSAQIFTLHEHIAPLKRDFVDLGDHDSIAAGARLDGLGELKVSTNMHLNGTGSGRTLELNLSHRLLDVLAWLVVD